ncbi:MAG TPA: ATP-binding protein, partial [Myxococcaceae bacterium]|nr:ATP-binding protein [Myxococcaceae bacterium]
LAVAGDLAYRAAMAIDSARLYQQAREADRRKDEFLAVLSHELRAPLAPLMTWVEVLRRAPDAAHVHHAAEVIERNVRVQRALINELLDLAAITRDKMALELHSLDLGGLLRGCAETLSGEARDKSIRFTIELPDEPLSIRGDPNRLHQVFANLISNALKFTPAGGVVSVTLRREGDVALARIRDTGEGIAPTFLPHVFEMFKQQEQGTRREHGGLGIGLALAKRLTELHMGTITATSEGPGRGTEFIVRLPLQDESADADTAAERGLEPSPPEHERPLHDLSILLVEDADDMREAMQVMLEELGARVMGACNGEEALVRLRPGETDVVLCDLRMPQMDGYEFVSLVRKDPARAHVPIVAVSGFASPESYRQSQEAGFDGYVTKPFEYATLVASLQQVIASRQRAEEAQRAHHPA